MEFVGPYFFKSPVPGANLQLPAPVPKHFLRALDPITFSRLHLKITFLLDFMIPASALLALVNFQIDNY